MKFNGNYSDTGQMQKFFELLRKNNVKSFSLEGLTVEFHSSEAMSSSNDDPIKDLSDMPPDDLMLFAATDEFDRMVDERNASTEPEVE